MEPAIFFLFAALVSDEPTKDADTSDDERLDRMERRLDALESENEALREEQDLAYEERDTLQSELDRARARPVQLGGYVDAGFFWAQANGAGTRSDLGHRLFPEYEGVVPDAWVFVGDPLSTAVNARGEPADTGDSRAVTFDSIDSRGGSTFLVNALNLDVVGALGSQVMVEGLVDFVPRGRDPSAPDGLFLGDYVDIKLAYMRWTPAVRRFRLDLWGGKIDSVFGREYRVLESPARTEVTPSLICRYTCGRPLGIKARASFFDHGLDLAFSLTNGSTYQEIFGFYDEIDRNDVKTGAGRVSTTLPVGAGLEIGASGMIGAQDLQRDDSALQWQYGADVHFEAHGLELTAEFLQGRATGKDDGGLARCGAAPCLRVIGAYGTVAYRALNWLMPFVRVDWRDAEHAYGASFVYLTQTTRLSPGVRFEVGEHVIIKAQYTVNLEVGRIPQIPNDILTTSFVAHF